MRRTTDVADKGIPEPHESWNLFSQVPLIQFLKLDPRPIFAVDLDRDISSPIAPLNFLFINPTLYTASSLYDAITGVSSRGNAKEESAYHSFLKWVRTKSIEGVSSEIYFGKFRWQSTLLQGRWNVLVANLTTVSTTDLGAMVIDSAAVKPIAASLPEGIATGLIDSQSDEMVTPPASQTSRGRTVEMNAQNFFLTESMEVNEEIDLEGKTPGSTQRMDNVAPATDIIDRTFHHDSHIAKRNAELLAKISAFATVAIYIVDMKGEILFCNESFYDMSELPRDQTNAMGWVSIFEDDEVPRVIDLWRRVAAEQEPIQFQARLKRRWNPSAAFASAPKDFPTWISAWTYPDMSSDGETVGACGVMTDVSEQKWSEQLMEQKLSDAVERARLSEQLSISAKQVADSERRFRSLADMMPVGIWLSDEHESIIYANEACLNMVPSVRISGELDWSLLREEDMSRVKEAYRQALEDHVKSTVEIYVAAPGLEHDIWMSITMYPELHADGRLQYLVGCMIDQTYLKLAEQTQGMRASDALAAKRQLEDFIDMTSHEMRNPLSAIIHSAEEILLTCHSQQLAEISTTTIANTIEAAQTIIYCTEHSTRIVDDILLVSKLESGLLDISPSIVQPIRSIKQSLSMFNGEMKAADISQSFKVDQSFKALGVDYVHLDMSRVLQIFVNLITNAIKFTRPEPVRQIDVVMKATRERPCNIAGDGGVRYLDALLEPSKAISGAPGSEDRTVYLTVEVRDSGCGLTAAEQKNLFQRFTQAGKRTHVKYGGTGLGLFISRQLCEMQDGAIGLRSAPMNGSTFAFFVKAQKALDHEISVDGIDLSTIDQKNVHMASLETKSHLASLSTPPTATAQNRAHSQDSVQSLRVQHTILLVEDNLVNQRVVAKRLKTNGYEVLVANHGEEALEHIRTSSLDSKQPPSAQSISLILLDLEMPVMDGLTCIHHIREMERLGSLRYHVPVIAVTANARQEQIDQAKDAGMDDVVTKPFRIEQLTSLVTQLVKQFPTLELSRVESS